VADGLIGCLLMIDKMSTKRNMSKLRCGIVVELRYDTYSIIFFTSSAR
jgi:hypothetical protein